MKTQTQIVLPTAELVARMATSKVIPDTEFKALSAQCVPGKYPVDCFVHIQGGLTKGEPYNQRVAAAVDTWKVIGLLLNKLNGATIEAVVEEALATDFDGTDLKVAAEQAVMRLVASTERECSGKVTGSLVWAEVRP